MVNILETEGCNCRNFVICEKDLKFLYEILKQRFEFEPGFNLPSYETHCNFLSKHKETYKQIKINSLNNIDYNIFYISSTNELAVYFHLQGLSRLNNKERKTVMKYSRYMLYNEIQSLNLLSFWSQAYKFNTTAINSIRQFYKQFISDKYNLEIIEEVKLIKHVFTRKT